MLKRRGEKTFRTPHGTIMNQGIQAGQSTAARCCIVVDDEPMARRFLADLLRKYVPDLRVAGEADSVDGAVALIREIMPDIVFLDAELIGGSWRDLLDRLPGRTFTCVFVFASAQAGEECRRVPDSRFLLKPIEIDELLAVARR